MYLAFVLRCVHHVYHYLCHSLHTSGQWPARLPEILIDSEATLKKTGRHSKVWTDDHHRFHSSTMNEPIQYVNIVYFHMDADADGVENQMEAFERFRTRYVQTWYAVRHRL